MRKSAVLDHEISIFSLFCPALSSTRLRREPPPGGSLLDSADLRFSLSRNDGFHLSSSQPRPAPQVFAVQSRRDKFPRRTYLRRRFRTDYMATHAMRCRSTAPAGVRGGTPLLPPPASPPSLFNTPLPIFNTFINRLWKSAGYNVEKCAYDVQKCSKRALEGSGAKSGAKSDKADGTGAIAG